MKKTIRFAFFSATVLVVMLVVFLAFPASPVVARPLARASHQWILTDYGVSGGWTARIRSAARKLVATYLQFAAAAQVHRQVEQRLKSNDDVERIATSLQIIREATLNQFQVSHPSRSWPVFISGLGFCDQVNGAVCNVLSGDFQKTQLWALEDPVSGTSPHTVARVWSDQYQDWLYADLFFDEALIYRKQGSAITILYRDANPRERTRGPVPRPDLYRLDGRVLNEYSSSYLMHLVTKARMAAQTDSPSAPVVESIPSPPPPQAEEIRDDKLFQHVADLYLRARLEHLFGRYADAVPWYRRAERDGRESPDQRVQELALASSMFVSRFATIAESP